MAVLIKANNEVSVVSPANGKFFDYKELQGFVGGYIELVRPNPGFFILGDTVLEIIETHIMWVNEEGLFENPIRWNRTILAMFGMQIAGDVVIVAETETQDYYENEEDDEEFEKLRRTDTYDGDDGQEDWLDEDDYARNSDENEEEAECHGCGGMFTEYELNMDHLCEGCAEEEDDE